MDRRAVLVEQIDIAGIGLEIGPSYNPLLPKAEGYRVESVDYADAATLRAKYRDAGVDVGRIETVDHVVRGGSILAAVGRPAHYDYIVASHVIEHTPDLLGFLKDCQDLLKPEGRLLLAVPDKRCCFDLFQPPSSLGAILQAYHERRGRPGLGSIVDDRAYNVRRGGRIGWALDDAGPLELVSAIGELRGMADWLARSDQYIDVHVWKFVPSSFRLIVSDLHAIGEIGLFEAWFMAGAGEFYAALSRCGERPVLDRLALLLRALGELRTPDGALPAPG